MRDKFNKPQEKEQIKMARIGKAAAKLFNEKGYLETSIADIASAIGMSKGGIFHYFPTKNEILYFILSNYMDLVLEGLEKDLEKFEGGFQKIEFIVSRHIALYSKNTSEAKALLHEAHNLPPKHFKVIAGKERKYFEITARVLSDFLGGSVPKDRLTALTFALFGMCNWIYSWYDPRGSLLPKELSEIIHNIFTRGVVSYHPLKKSSIGARDCR